jgi:hypothetical protein
VKSHPGKRSLNGAPGHSVVMKVVKERQNNSVVPYGTLPSYGTFPSTPVLG